jgi:hypothetical protein
MSVLTGGLGLAANLDGTMFVALPDSSIMNIAGSAARIQVDRQHPPGSRSRVIDRHRGRLVRRGDGQQPGVTGRVGTAAVSRDADVRRTGDRERDRMPSGLGGGAREAVRIRVFYTRRVARGQC